MYVRRSCIRKYLNSKRCYISQVLSNCKENSCIRFFCHASTLFNIECLVLCKIHLFIAVRSEKQYSLPISLLIGLVPMIIPC